MIFGEIADELSTGATIEQVQSLDRKIRASELATPAYLQHGRTSSNMASVNSLSEHDRVHIRSQQHMLSLLHHKALLFMHRPFFARAMSASDDPMSSPHSSSFIACITSARKHSHLLDSILSINPIIANCAQTACSSEVSDDVHRVVVRWPQATLNPLLTLILASHFTLTPLRLFKLWS